MITRNKLPYCGYCDCSTVRRDRYAELVRMALELGKNMQLVFRCCDTDWKYNPDGSVTKLGYNIQGVEHSECWINEEIL